MGIAGAEELAKGDWPELLVLNIRWGVLAWCLCIELHTASKVRLKCLLDVTVLVHAVGISWVQRGQPTMQLDAGPSYRSLTFRECSMAA